MLAEQADRLSELFEAHGDRLYRLARRLVSDTDDALDQWRKEAVRKHHAPELKEAAAQHGDPEAAFLIRATVWKALDSLPPRRRAVVVMSEIDGLSMASIAALLGINAITVRWHLSRGRRELAQKLRAQLLGETHEQPEKALAGRRPTPSRTSAR
jgi:DNA-directed RNA polymerase specialized sigma24 family protein